MSYCIDENMKMLHHITILITSTFCVHCNLKITTKEEERKKIIWRKEALYMCVHIKEKSFCCCYWYDETLLLLKEEYNTRKYNLTHLNEYRFWVFLNKHILPYDIRHVLCSFINAEKDSKLINKSVTQEVSLYKYVVLQLIKYITKVNNLSQS